MPGDQDSMSRKGNPLDNATMESFFHSMKAELIHQRTFENEIEAVVHLFADDDRSSKRERVHQRYSETDPDRFESPERKPSGVRSGLRPPDQTFADPGCPMPGAWHPESLQPPAA